MGREAPGESWVMLRFAELVAGGKHGETDSNITMT